MEIARFSVGIFCCIIAIIVMIIHKLKILRCTEKTTGKITQRDTENIEIYENNQYRTVEHYYIICQYSVENHNFEERVKIGTSDDLIYGDERYYTGTSVDVYYNPRN